MPQMGVCHPKVWCGLIYSANPVESINAGLEKMAMDLRNYFPSERTLEVNLFIQMANLQDK